MTVMLTTISISSLLYEEMISMLRYRSEAAKIVHKADTKELRASLVKVTPNHHSELLHRSTDELARFSRAFVVISAYFAPASTSLSSERHQTSDAVLVFGKRSSILQVASIILLMAM
ncbi:hypothetical protein CUR178_01729 [Leishmania enriettii]|uniref:Kinesin motor domain-containing protein n=1 Tax=Leishmania enriettii TaxID=5663 RepID=A0A836KKC8_LEIEN|nr:hypothetical protein CUR178_01729 [Leishmania enriettii]